MLDKNRFGKILVPLVTPFKEDMSVDYDAMAKLAAQLVEKGLTDSIILTGTTGEFFTMSPDERAKAFEVVFKEVGKKVPIIAGVGCAATHETIELAKKAEKVGIDTCMVVAPYYTKPSQLEIKEHYKKVAAGTGLDIMLYNIPIFTGVNIEPETVRELCAIKNIVAIKEEAELNAKQMTAYLNNTPDDFIVYCGDDTMVLEALAQGGERIGGFVSGGCHIASKQIRQMIADFFAGKVLEAGAMQRKLLPLFRSMGQGGRTNPVCLLKSAMKLVGLNGGLPRQPLLPATDAEMVLVKKEMQNVGIL